VAQYDDQYANCLVGDSTVILLLLLHNNNSTAPQRAEELTAGEVQRFVNLFNNVNNNVIHIQYEYGGIDNEEDDNSNNNNNNNNNNNAVPTTTGSSTTTGEIETTTGDDGTMTINFLYGYTLLYNPTTSSSSSSSSSSDLSTNDAVLDYMSEELFQDLSSFFHNQTSIDLQQVSAQAVGMCVVFHTKLRY
jgi:hypothetical protein